MLDLGSRYKKLMRKEVVLGRIVIYMFKNVTNPLMTTKSQKQAHGTKQSAHQN